MVGNLFLFVFFVVVFVCMCLFLLLLFFCLFFCLFVFCVCKFRTKGFYVLMTLMSVNSRFHLSLFSFLLGIL